MAARYHFIIEQLFEVMAAPHARQGQFACPQPLDVALIIGRFDQLVAAAVVKTQEVIKKLAGIRRFNEALQPKLRDVAAQIDPEVLAINNLKRLSMLAQQPVTVGMKGGGTKASG